MMYGNCVYTLSTYLVLCIHCIWLFLSYILYNQLVIGSEVIPEVCGPV